MDCKTFDEIALDLLYEEAPERDLTLDDARRHVEGCGRCAGVLSTLRRGRELSAMTAMPVPAGLAERIMAAAAEHEARQEQTFWRRLDRFISLAGSYAMRPQAAMSTLLLLMVGTSLLLLRARPAGPGAVRITEDGVPASEPAASAKAPAAVAMPDFKRAAEGHAGKGDERPAAAAAAAPKAVEAPREKEAEALATAAPGAPSPKEPAAIEAQPTAPAPQAAPADAPVDAGYSAAMEAFKARRYAEAVRSFDVVAQGGGQHAPSAALHAARATRYSSGCGAAVSRYDAVASRYVGSGVAAEASYEAAMCYREMGQTDRARQLFQALRRTAGYRDRAEKELNALDGKAPARDDRPAAAGKPTRLGDKQPATLRRRWGARRRWCGWPRRCARDHRG